MKTWTAQSWLAAFVLAIVGFWPYWAFHSRGWTVTWLIFLGFAFIAIMAVRANRHR